MSMLPADAHRRLPAPQGFNALVEELDAAHPEEMAEARGWARATLASPPQAQWDDPRVQAAYGVLVADEEPPEGQHWEGWAARRIVDVLDAPIDMVLHCPACGLQHIDAPMTDAQYAERLHESSWWECGGDKPERWTNPPHRSHLCHGCGHTWRPADVPTNGVAAVKTKGKADSPAAVRQLVGYMSPKQLPLIVDPEDTSGVYIPLRKTSAGNFTLALYAIDTTGN